MNAMPWAGRTSSICFIAAGSGMNRKAAGWDGNGSGASYSEFNRLLRGARGAQATL